MVVTSARRKFQSEERVALLTKCYLGDRVKQNVMLGIVACMWEWRGAHRVLVEKTKRKKPLVKPRRR